MPEPEGGYEAVRHPFTAAFQDRDCPSRENGEAGFRVLRELEEQNVLLSDSTPDLPDAPCSLMLDA
jgi:hypothetical protein